MDNSPGRITANPRGRSKEWCYTLFRWGFHDDSLGPRGESNPGPSAPERFKSLHPSEFIYHCWQGEICPSSGEQHLQGYICLPVERNLAGLKSRIFSSQYAHVHAHICAGSKDANKTYCSKEDSRDPSIGAEFHELGDFHLVPERTGQGARNDVHGIARVVSDGGDLLDAAKFCAGNFVRYHRGLSCLRTTLFCLPRRKSSDGTWPIPSIYWFYGETGTGKSCTAYELIGDEPYYTKPPGDTWFDGYCGESIVLLDDYRADWFKFGYLLRLLDCYPLQVAVKGGYVHFSATTIYITCPRSPSDLYSNLEARQNGSLAQLLRRITTIRLFGDEPSDPTPLLASFNPYPTGDF